MSKIYPHPSSRESYNRVFSNPPSRPIEEKPKMSYSELIMEAICSSSRQRMYLGEIYDFIMRKYKYYRVISPGWKNSIRHALSASKLFNKIPSNSRIGRRKFVWGLSKIAKTESEKDEDIDTMHIFYGQTPNPNLNLNTNQSVKIGETMLTLNTDNKVVSEPAQKNQKSVGVEVNLLTRVMVQDSRISNTDLNELYNDDYALPPPIDVHEFLDYPNSPFSHFSPMTL